MFQELASDGKNISNHKKKYQCFVQSVVIVSKIRIYIFVRNAEQE